MCAAVAASLALAACDAGPSSSGGRTITLYNGQHPQTTAALVSAFERQTGIFVQVRNGDEDVLASQIAQEGSGSPADVYYAENSPALQFLAEKGLLSPVTPSTLARVPAQYNSPHGRWVGVSARVSGFVYNTARLTPAELPTSVMDLAGPRWAGKLGLAPSETDFEPVVISVARTFGDAAALRWLKGLQSNAAGHIYPDNESLVAAVNSGQVAIAIIDHYYWYRLHYEIGPSRTHSAFEYFAPRDPGYVVDVSGAAVLSSSSHQAEAQRFVAFLVSETGQQIIAHSQSYEYPLASGVSTAQPLRPFEELQPTTLSIADLGDGRRAISLLQQAQLL
jgi:iron(III) transport system substrate-binding protein